MKESDRNFSFTAQHGSLQAVNAVHDFPRRQMSDDGRQDRAGLGEYSHVIDVRTVKTRRLGYDQGLDGYTRYS